MFRIINRQKTDDRLSEVRLENKEVRSQMTEVRLNQKLSSVSCLLSSVLYLRPGHERPRVGQWSGAKISHSEKRLSHKALGISRHCYSSINETSPSVKDGEVR